MTAPRRSFTSTHGTSYDDDHWATRGACNDHDPELWYATGNDLAAMADKAEAKRICRTQCPVRARCLQEALDNRDGWGIRGGYDEDERKAHKRKAARSPAIPTQAKPEQKPAKNRNPSQEARREADRARALQRRADGTEPPCGTRAGYDHHRAIGEPYCDTCRAHRATASQAERARNRKPSQADTLVPEVLHLVSVGADLHQAARATSKTVGALEKALQRARRHDLLRELRRTA